MKLNKNGGIEIYIAAQKPDGVPEENWLPINRKDEDLSVNLRIYVPDEEKMKTWTAPKAERLGKSSQGPPKEDNTTARLNRGEEVFRMIFAADGKSAKVLSKHPVPLCIKETRW